MKIDINKLKEELLLLYKKNAVMQKSLKEDNIVRINFMVNDNNIIRTITYDLNNNVYTAIWNEGNNIYQENVINRIVRTQRYFTHPIIKVTSKLRKVNKLT